MRTTVPTLPGYINEVILRYLGRIKVVGKDYHGHIDGSIAGDDNGRGLGVSSHGKVFVAVAASGFGPAVTTEQISKRRQLQ